MALTHNVTGYYGYTVDAGGSYPVDSQGRVKKCIFTVIYPYHLYDTEVTITRGANDWGARMGNSKVIALSNPVILYKSHDNAVIEFDMAEPYPSNSPCFLVYRSNTAKITVNRSDFSAPFTINSASGHFAMTTQGFGGGTFADGYVNRLLGYIYFPYHESEVDFKISNDPSHWGVRMGNGSIIALRNPRLLTINENIAVILFSMDSTYPSNSPGILVYRSADAYYEITPKPTSTEFVPVTNITNVPTSAVAGVGIDLSIAAVEPFNATNVGITWSILSGPATVNGDQLTTTTNGTVKLKATIKNGASPTTDFTKTWDIIVSRNVINITLQPLSKLNVNIGKINDSLIVAANATNGIVTYQWYRNTTNSTTGATAISGETNPTFAIPTNLTKGHTYYFCKVSSPGATSVNSIVSDVYASIELEGIRINPRTASIPYGGTQQYSVSPVPSGADLPAIHWSTSNNYVIQVSGTGLVSAIGSGNGRLIATTTDGKFSDYIDISVAQYVSVADITGIITETTSGANNTLAPVITPANSTQKTIVWTMVNAASTGATITTSGVLSTPAIGTITIRATVPKGISPYQDFVKDFKITVNRAFVPVTDVIFSGIPDTIRVKDIFKISTTVKPDNATYKDVVLELASTTKATLSGDFLTCIQTGVINVTAVVKNGTAPGADFRKLVSITILPEFIPVTSISVTPTEYDPNPKNDVHPNGTNSGAVTLTIGVFPSNATNKTVKTKFVSVTEGEVSFDSNTNQLSTDISKLTYDMNITVKIEVRITNGASPSEDFVNVAEIKVIPPDENPGFIPVESLSMEFPTPYRTFYPVLPRYGTITPEMATNKNIVTNVLRTREYDGICPTVTFGPVAIKETVKQLSDFFDWHLQMTYIIPLRCGYYNQYQFIFGGLGPDTESQEDCFKSVIKDVEVLPPYIPVNDIINIPLTIPCSQDVVLTGEIDTDAGTKHHCPNWNEEEASYQDIEWRMGSQYINPSTYPNTANGVIKDGNRIRATTPGKFTIQAAVHQGVQEAIQWYTQQQEGVTYTKMFTITATQTEAELEYAILTLTLADGSEVEMKKPGEMSMLCNDLPADSTIMVGGVSFKKNEVESIAFNSDVMPEEPEDPFKDFLENETFDLDHNKTTKYSIRLESGKKVQLTPTEIIRSRFLNNTAEHQIYISGDTVYSKTNDNSDPTKIVGDSAVVFYHPNPFGNHIGVEYYVLISSGKPKTSWELVVFGINFKNPVDTYYVDRSNLQDIVLEAEPASFGYSVDGDASTYTKNMEYLKSLISFRAESIDAGTIEETDFIQIDDSSMDGKFIISFPSTVKPGTYHITFSTYRYLIPAEQSTMYVAKGSNGKYLFRLEYYLSFIKFTDNAGLGLNGKSGHIFNYHRMNKTFVGGVSTSSFLTELESGKFIIPYPVEMNKTSNVTILLSDSGIPSSSENSHYIKPSFVLTDDGIKITSHCTWDNMESYPYLYILTDRWDDSVSSVDRIRFLLNNETISRTIKIVVQDEFPKELSLKNFGRNFTSLTSVSKIPKVTGESCLENFLRGCTSFDQDIIIPKGVTGDKCLKYFLRDCTSFNSNITIPDGVTGNSCMHGFLYNCKAFNRPIAIPSSVTGDSSLKRFLRGCIVFNQPLDIPENLEGYECMMDFLRDCKAFNQDLTLPLNMPGGNQAFYGLLADGYAMKSRVIFPIEIIYAGNVNDKTFGTVYSGCPMAVDGVTVVSQIPDIAASYLFNWHDGDEGEMGEFDIRTIHAVSP